MSDKLAAALHPSGTVEEQFTLTSADRCDTRGCGARAYWRFVHKRTLRELYWCGHHGALYEGVVGDAYIVFDERAQINAQPDASPA